MDQKSGHGWTEFCASGCNKVSVRDNVSSECLTGAGSISKLPWLLPLFSSLWVVRRRASVPYWLLAGGHSQLIATGVSLPWQVASSKQKESVKRVQEDGCHSFFYSPTLKMTSIAFVIFYSFEAREEDHTRRGVSEWVSEFAQSWPTLCNPMDSGHQAPPSMGFSRQEYQSALPFPSLGDLLDPERSKG